MAVEYAWRGIIGVLTPQANTTVEPELAILAPPGTAILTARMVSAAARLEDRLRDYFAHLSPVCAQFANAPLGVIAIACTGASYLATHDGEAALVADAAAQAGVPVLTSARCVLDALQALDARRIGLVSPYGAALTQASVHYWQKAGFEVANVVEVAPHTGSFHPIYSLQTRSITQALDRLAEGAALDAAVVLGTGLPSLQSILDRPRVGTAPVFSCMVATAWRSVLVLDGAAPTRDNLLRWIDDPEWGVRLLTRLRPRQAAA